MLRFSSPAAASCLASIRSRGEPTRQLLQQADLSAVGAIVNGLLNNNPGAAATAIAAAANSGNTAAITSAISFAGLAEDVTGSSVGGLAK
ncbi:hypothetical protein WJX74_003244 [Apatococcus lobatus]|uniref:Uncharacterized protein n=1 Tax=Apatococcus lobatus TaxID=904363 RepID=A0AAW1RLC7_9CHLO